MQTFLPYDNFTETAKVLDRQRLGKQRVEAYQIVLVNLKRSQGLEKGAWLNHPAVKMWYGFEYQLCEYAITICNEWINRGYVDNLKPKLLDLQKQFKDTGLPPWFGKSDFHLSHKSKLLQKLPVHYIQYFPDTPDSLDYVWYV